MHRHRRGRRSGQGHGMSAAHKPSPQQPQQSCNSDHCCGELSTVARPPPQQPCNSQAATKRNSPQHPLQQGCNSPQQSTEPSPQQPQQPPKGWRNCCAHRNSPRAYPRAPGQTPSRLRLRLRLRAFRPDCHGTVHTMTDPHHKPAKPRQTGPARSPFAYRRDAAHRTTSSRTPTIAPITTCRIASRQAE
jgi:hypothetical protein